MLHTAVFPPAPSAAPETRRQVQRYPAYPDSLDGAGYADVVFLDTEVTRSQEIDVLDQILGLDLDPHGILTDGTIVHLVCCVSISLRGNHASLCCIIGAHVYIYTYALRPGTICALWTVSICALRPPGILRGQLVYMYSILEL